ncbi:hypothetical protein GCM10023259_009310 [Thermocatellispora tengchongensis]
MPCCAQLAYHPEGITCTTILLLHSGQYLGGSISRAARHAVWSPSAARPPQWSQYSLTAPTLD